MAIYVIQMKTFEKDVYIKICMVYKCLVRARVSLAVLKVLKKFGLMLRPIVLIFFGITVHILCYTAAEKIRDLFKKHCQFL